MSRRERRKREESRARVRAAEAPIARAAAPHPGREPSRSTFGVARAQARLAEALPDIIYRKPAPKPQARRIDQEDAQRSERVPGPLVAKRRADKGQAQRNEPGLIRADGRPPLENRPTACKPRPQSNAPRKGGGSSRGFVPWCRK